MTGHDPLDIAKQEQQRKQNEVEEAKRIEQETADYRWLMSFKQGRRLVWQQLKEARVYHSVFSESHAQMALHEGKRSAGLTLIARVVKYCPELYLKMQEENAPNA